MERLNEEFQNAQTDITVEVFDRNAKNNLFMDKRAKKSSRQSKMGTQLLQPCIETV